MKTAFPIPAAGAIGSDTRLPVSRRFDCADAIGRLREPARRDRALLSRSPHPVGFLRGMARDPGRRLLLVAVVVAALLGCAIAFA
jgi:hypothetical protein